MPELLSRQVASPAWPWRLLSVASVALVAVAPFFAERSPRLFVFVAIILLASGALAVKAGRQTWSWKTVLILAVAVRLAVFWLQPGLSDDAYRYIWDGLVQAHGVNPYVHRPADDALAFLQDEPIFSRLNSTSYYSVYPPLSQLIFLAGSQVYATNWVPSYYLIKLIILLIEIAGLFALSRLTSPSVGVLYAWNPIVVIEVAGQGHPDGVAAALVLLCILAVRHRRPAWAGAALAGAALVKLYPLLLLPLLWRRAGRASLYASVGVILVLSLPFVHPSVPGHLIESLNLYVNLFEFNAGPYYTIKEIARLVTGEDLSKFIGPALRYLLIPVLTGLFILSVRQRWGLERSFLAFLSAFFLLSTTIHPWYLVPLLALISVENRYRWHWYALAAVSCGTYLLYIDGPYWTVVIAGWSVWMVLAITHHSESLFLFVQRKRAERKLVAIEDWLPTELPSMKLLDLGCGEGYVGLAAAQKFGANVVLADVIPMNRTDLPWVEIDGRTVPFSDDSFDAVILYFVLHHAEDPKAVLGEAARVSRGSVIVVESVFETKRQRSRLAVFDRLANRIRSGGQMVAQEEHLHFRTTQEWCRLFDELRLNVLAVRERGGAIHRRAYFLVND